MSNTPIIIVSGKAGSGKDTVAGYIAENYNGVCVAQADPMKRFVKGLVGFTDHQLWGPSEARNAAVPAADLNHLTDAGLEMHGDRLCLDVFGHYHGADSMFFVTLKDWYNTYVRASLDKNGEISARVVLQTLGTEWGRKFAPKMWIERAITNARKLVEGGFTYTREGGMVTNPDRAFDYAVITDGRFRNEMLGVAYLGGTTWRVTRPSKELKLVGIAGHKSESEMDGIPDHFFSDTIVNDSTFEALYSQVDDMMAVQYGDLRRMGA
jgi:hypothetical protein